MRLDPFDQVVIFAILLVVPLGIVILNDRTKPQPLERKEPIASTPRQKLFRVCWTILLMAFFLGVAVCTEVMKWSKGLVLTATIGLMVSLIIAYVFVKIAWAWVRGDYIYVARLNSDQEWEVDCPRCQRRIPLSLPREQTSSIVEFQCLQCGSERTWRAILRKDLSDRIQSHSPQN